MPSFEALGHYSAFLVVLSGLGTFVGVLGTGLAMLRALPLRLASPWAEVVAALLGAGTLSLLVQALAMSGRATPAALIAVFSAYLLIGAAECAIRVRELRVDWRALRGNGVLLAILLAGGGLNLLVAAAPSTKIDEIYYQMLVPARIVLDGELSFYLRPWPAAILPQLGYTIAGAPLHALGLHDAPNVWSWCLIALLSWFTARLVTRETGSIRLGLLAAAATQIGLYPSVYGTTGGAHALGDLATAAAVLALAFREGLLRSQQPHGFLLLLSICCVMAASSKVSLLPLSGLILLAGLLLTWRDGRIRWLPALVALATPWLVLYLPLCVWTLWQSGSPFGPMLADVLAPSPFGEAVRDEIAHSGQVNQGGLVYGLRDYVLHYPVVFPLAIAALLLLPAANTARRPLLALLLFAQLLIVVILLPHQARFFSGLHHALLTVGLIQAQPLAERWLARPRIGAAIVGVLLVPWLCVQAYRSYYLAPIALGFGEPEDYYRSYVALYDDFLALDRILPPDAVLLARDRLPSIYFPRPVYMHHRDLPAGRRAFALLGTSKLPVDAYDCARLRLPGDCRLGEPVYTNPEARHKVFRRPGRAPDTDPLEVREILSKGGGSG